MTLLRYIGGLIMVCVTELSLPVYNISIFDVRRTFCGSTKVNKDILQERIKKYIKLDLKDKDAIDAIGVGITHHLMKEAVEESTKQSSK
jgi:Holliday junction resolvasome RuvABC endonuclease subunit